MLVEWSKKLEIGVPFVDSDHKVLINLLNQVDQCILENEDTSVLGSVLDALVEYTDYHFLREEKMMELSDYVGLETHRATHTVLSQQVRLVFNNYQDDPKSVKPKYLRDFLQSWLVDHIMGSDFAYRDTFLANQALSETAGQINFSGAEFQEWGHIRVMLVDDNPNFCRLIRTVLRAVGVKNIQVVNNPLEGLERLVSKPADIVLCDWVMEEMNGTEFVHKVQQMGIPSRVVMLTGFSTDILRERSSDIGVSDYIEKPIRARELLETISRVAMSTSTTKP